MPLRLVQFTDCHLFASPTRKMHGVVTLESLHRVLETASGDVDRADAILLTGDLVHDESAGYEHYKMIFGASEKPVFCLPGNHDTEDLKRVLCVPPFVTDMYRDLAGWRIIILNSQVPGEVSGELGSTQLANLDALLASTTASGLFALIAVHHPPVPLGTPWIDGMGLADGSELLRLVEKHRCVRAVVSGHAHQAHSSQHGGCKIFCTPSTSSQFKPGSESVAFDKIGAGYRWIQLGDDGSVESGVVRVDARSVGNGKL